MKETLKNNISRTWLKKMADAEDQCESISVGGLAHDLGMLSQSVNDTQQTIEKSKEQDVSLRSK